LTAKQRALRDQAPRGLRLWLPQSGNLMVTDCQYIEQPDDFSSGFIASDATRTIITFGGLTNDLYNGYTPADFKYWNVQPGDYIEVFSTGLMHQIVPSVAIPTGVSPNAVSITPPLPYVVSTPTPNYRIVRAPRAVGEEMLKMPDGVVIDLNTNVAFNNPLPPVIQVGESGFVDILFGPSGAVISRGVSTANIHLWVRAPHPDNQPDPFLGAPTILSVFVRTGFTGAYPVSKMGGPYAEVK
jgi:hypothetical protein